MTRSIIIDALLILVLCALSLLWPETDLTDIEEDIV